MPTTAKTNAEFWARFWSKVDQTGDCWLWTGATTVGYGSLRHRGRTLYAHRIVLADTLGRELLPGENTCHRCDVRPCVNPAHLFVGSHSDNLVDCANKFRGNGRKDSPVAKLTDDAVLEIRRLYAAGKASQQHLARHFGVSQTTISKIVRRAAWRRLN